MYLKKLFLKKDNCMKKRIYTCHLTLFYYFGKSVSKKIGRNKSGAGNVSPHVLSCLRNEIFCLCSGCGTGKSIL